MLASVLLKENLGTKRKVLFLIEWRWVKELECNKTFIEKSYQVLHCSALQYAAEGQCSDIPQLWSVVTSYITVKCNFYVLMKNMNDRGIVLIIAEICQNRFGRIEIIKVVGFESTITSLCKQGFATSRDWIIKPREISFVKGFISLCALEADYTSRIYLPTNCSWAIY